MSVFLVLKIDCQMGSGISLRGFHCFGGRHDGYGSGDVVGVPTCC